MKLRVESLARIKEAEVDVKNLTLFVGQNSTHKSYMAHVIYELFKEISDLDTNFNKKNKVVSTVIKKANQLAKNEIDYLSTLSIEVTQEEEYHQYSEDEYDKEIFTLVGIELDDSENVISLKNLVYDLIQDELANIINGSFNSPIKVLSSLFIGNVKDIPIRNRFNFRFDIPIDNYDVKRSEISARIVGRIANIFLDNLVVKLQKYMSAYYFPASRTGFVLTLDEIYAGIFRDKFRGQVSATRLGEPTIDFIQTFADIKSGKSIERDIFSLFNNERYSDKEQKKLIDFLEEKIIKGKIKEHKNNQDYISYYLEVNNEKIDLHMASSATLETLPFIIFLNNTSDITKTFFVIEEPEAHLHPKAQIQMAKFIVMLSNVGAKVLVTTHSDYILNEINNCIKLDTLDVKSDFSISKDNVSAYLFKNETNETTVKELEINKFGISNDNFDEALEELLDLSNDLNERIIDNE